MKIPNNLTDKSFLALANPEGTYSNTNEMIGDLSQLTDTLHAAINRGQNQVTSEVLGILSGITGLTIKASRSYIHK